MISKINENDWDEMDDITTNKENHRKDNILDIILYKACFLFVCLILVVLAAFAVNKIERCILWLYQRIVGVEKVSLYTETGYDYDVTYTDTCVFEVGGDTWTFSPPMVYNGYQFDNIEVCEFEEDIVFYANYNMTELTTGGSFKSDIVGYITPVSNFGINALAKEKGVEVVEHGDKVGCVYYVDAEAEDEYATNYYDCTFTDGAYCYELKLYVEKARQNYFSQATSGVTSGLLKAYGYEGSLIALMDAFKTQEE